MRRLRAIVIISILILSGCTRLDVVGKDAVRAFGDVIAVLPAEEYDPDCWKLTSPDGGAWFAWDNMSVSMVVDAAPFAAAGADLAKLENCSEHYLNPGKQSLYFTSPGFDMLNQNVKETALDQFSYCISCLRNKLGYHTEMDHYNLNLDGATFEWAKDMKTNDKDIVFVLDAEPLIAAGVNPENVDGWAYGQVTVQVNGKPADVWKLLKPFDLS
jgi:hypothetical protein